MLKLLTRELQIYMHCKAEALGALLFFIIIISLYPLAFGPIPKDLNWLIPGIIWIAALLASVLAQESLFRTDYNIGILEQMILSKQPFVYLIATKILAHWLVSALPLVLISPVLAICLGLSWSEAKFVTLSLLIGTPILSLIAALGSALTLTLARSGVLLAILVLPLYIPILVLGTTLGINAIYELNINGHIALLLAIAIFSGFALCFAVSSIIKVSNV